MSATDIPLLLGTTKIVADRHVSDWKTVRRSWKERLLSLPWQPLQQTKTIYSPISYRLADSDTVIVSHQTYEALTKLGVIL